MSQSNDPENAQMGADTEAGAMVPSDAETDEPVQPDQSANRLVLTVALSALVAVVIVVFAVMPAEYGIDPTGVGRMVGLTSLKADQPRRGHGDLPSQPSASGALASAIVPDQSNEGSVTLQPGESIEVKADMIGGQGFSYRWSTDGGAVEVDMHGVDQSYLQAQDQTGDQGVFIAPTDGLFGWYWVNRGQAPVVVTLWTSGYYKGLVRTEVAKETP